MSARTLHFVVPGDIETKTGGYGYDRQIIAGLRRRGWVVHVVSLPGNYPSPSGDERAAASRSLAAIPDASCVLVDGLAYGVLPDEAAREQARLRLVALVHHPLGLESGIDQAASERLLRSERAALSAAVGVVVTSPRTVGAVEVLGVRTDRIVVVEPGTEPMPAATGSGSGPLRMLCVASLVPRKGHDTLLDALERLAHLPWHLTCAGSADRDPAHASALARRCETGPLRGRVTLTGELAGTALDTAYDTADLFVLPTHYEGYGMVVAEALARGIPVVSTATGAIPELVGDAAGVLVPAADAASLARVLERLLTDRASVLRMREGAMRARASLPTWDVATLRMEEALGRLGCR
jgi:glycosyltransferase involved in cell wall biosynthesis